MSRTHQLPALPADLPIQELMRRLAEDQRRTECIVAEALAAWEEGRKLLLLLLLLSERTDHITAIAGALAEQVPSLFLLHGRLSARQRSATLAELEELPPDAPHILRQFGQADAAEQLQEEALVLRRRFHDAFWIERLGTYALAIDGAGRPCEVRSSNAGHCLWSGIASAETAAAVARQLLAPSSFNGWGVRTLDEREVRFNPMSYHNGSVWPHDNSLIALGLARYGHTEAALRLLTGLFDAATAMPLTRLPELFCGFARQPEEAPTLYPVACSPQAWASGTPFGLLEAVMGMGIGRDSRSARATVLFRNPVLPAQIQRLEIQGLRLGDEAIDLELHRTEEDTGVLVKRRSRGVDVVIHK